MRAAREIFGGGLKSVLNPSYRRDQIIQDAMRSLATSQQALEFINSPGWRVMMDQYQSIVVGMEEYLRSLCRRSKRNHEEIQKTSDFVDAFQIVINMTDKIVAMHGLATATITKNQETAQGR
ncbi:MAG: hypothetical protein JRC86_08115 [Deltaproteobacteria bacterium]|nr:hypothetical protein [Deltaproteobacteria bacterium]